MKKIQINIYYETFLFSRVEWFINQRFSSNIAKRDPCTVSII